MQWVVIAQAATSSPEPTPLIYGSLAAIVAFAALVARVLASNNTRVDTAMQAQVTSLKDERDNARKDAADARDAEISKAQEVETWRQRFEEERTKRMAAEYELRLRGLGPTEPPGR